MAFDVDIFVTACRRARDKPDPVSAIAEIVREAVSEGPALARSLPVPADPFRPEPLYLSADLTVLPIVFRGGARSGVHDHTMWAVVGVYAGREVNRFYERSTRGLVESGGCEVESGGVLTLDPDAIHEVANPRREATAGLHVYGGDLMVTPRSAWTFDQREVPYAGHTAQRRVMFEAMWALAAEQGRNIDDDTRFIALTAIWDACEARRRCLTSAETRTIVGDAWDSSDT